MTMTLRGCAGLGPLLFAFATAPAQATCGAAFCTVNTSWDVQGMWAEHGLRADLRYEYVQQDQPRTGSTRLGVGQIRRHHDEIETSNRNLVASLDYTFSARWGVRLSVPVASREHAHVHNHHGARLYEAWDFTRLGDIRLLGRYQLPTSQSAGSTPQQRVSGLMFGMKLPTGQYDLRNAAGLLAERSLQPGSGTTDLLLGGYARGSLPLRDLSWFGQALVELPLHERAGYKPGTRFGIDVGLRHDLTDRLGLMLQLNSLFRSRDHGVQAERNDSGGRAFFVSPGVSYAFGDRVQAYAFYQHPLYQSVNGVQLTIRRAVVVGVGGRF